jgi:hypothetical protein
VGQGQRCDQQVGAADLLELLVLPQFVKVIRGCRVDRDDGDPAEQFLAAPQPVLGLAELPTVARLEDKVKPSADDLNPRDDGGDNLPRIESLFVMQNSRVPGMQPRESVRIEDVHCHFSVSDRPRCR